ncbi:hypothetical protein CLHOM_02680 [Clostridium homopropionicum DSM 5847]|uniref:Uncharacterized protein n=1 Tax=Clostridium homopropionicum DSM 5847 TaxID=1121318 RepID=A0A0L6ZEB3_9CLOT|nr:hypothetical protein [Clostridium homopropionicum]KOA21138.1 hypothetical protein CLHOM_02680 [Clostridium homopropionicum DSM 5847]SFG24970.1 hypothetical protein SAMN04488501_1079 [Clostridium homopropionicum]
MFIEGQPYESIAYNKDLLSGEISENKKSKRQRGIKGKVLLELFNAETKEKIKEAYTENLIPDLFFKDTFLGHFVQGIMGAGNTRRCDNYSWFEYLYLTDNDKPENANEQRVMGNIIGFAHRNTTYSGNDTRRGTINRAESKFEVTDSKIKMNFVFDFPTHAANGKIESIYWAESDPDNKDYFYTGAALYGREGGDTDYGVNSIACPRRYWVATVMFPNARTVKFTSPTKGWVLLDSRSTGVTQTSYLHFPESLKNHWLMMPFDLNTSDIVLWDQVVKLLNSDGNPLNIDSNHAVKKYDGLSYVCPYIQPDGELIFIGYYLYSINSESYMRIYKWTKVGVQLSFVDINMSQTFKDTAYNVPFNYRTVSSDGIYLDGCIDIVGYTSRTDSQYNETVYTNRWIRVDAAGNKVQDMNIKPKIGNSIWFGKMGMDSGNIERRCLIHSFYRSVNRIYLYYNGTQGGTSFYQVITPQGNLLEPYKMYFSFPSGYSYYYYQNILGTDRWISRYMGSSYNCLFIQALLTSRPIGAHTKLAQPVEKTEANTMKVQYMFEVDLINYGEDFY